MTAQDSRLLLRVASITTELTTRRPNANAAPAPPSQVVQVVLWPLGTAGYDVLGGQKVTLVIADPQHPLIPKLAVDQVFELAPVSLEAP